MALSAALLEKLPGSLHPQLPGATEALLPVPELAEALPGGGLPRGAVTELAVLGGSGLATRLALGAVRAVQQEARAFGAPLPWCAFVDPTGSLHGPGVLGAGVELARLLVLRPERAAVERAALRAAESRAFAVVVVDLLGPPGAELGLPLAGFTRAVRRLSLALAGSGTALLLLTDAEAPRPLPLPVALRVELTRTGPAELTTRVAKDRQGRVGGPRRIPWGEPRAKGLGPGPSGGIREQAS